MVGNIRPVDEKSEAYGVLDLSHVNSDWQKLDPTAVGQPNRSQPAQGTSPPAEPPENRDAKSPDVSDVVYQSKTTASTISLNSACRPSENSPESQENLATLTHLLLLGISDVSLREEKPRTLQGGPALQTTIRGLMEGQPVMLRTVVLKRANCDYDLVYLSTPEHFDAGAPDFERFVESLRLH